MALDLLALPKGQTSSSKTIGHFLRLDLWLLAAGTRGHLGFAKSSEGSGEASTSLSKPFGLQAHPRDKSNSEVRHIILFPLNRPDSCHSRVIRNQQYL